MAQRQFGRWKPHFAHCLCSFEGLGVSGLGSRPEFALSQGMLRALSQVEMDGLPSDQPLCRKGFKELHAAVCWCIEPVIKLLRLQDHHHAFFIGGFVKLAHQGMLVGIDSQHAEAAQDLARGGLPSRPDTCQAHRLAIGTADACGDSFAQAPVRFVERIDRDDAVPTQAPSCRGQIFSDIAIGEFTNSLLFQVLLLELVGRTVAQRRMQSAVIVEGHPVHHRQPRPAHR